MQRLSDQIRSLALKDYVLPARNAGRLRLSIAVRDLHTSLAKRQTMRGKSAVICQALKSRKFLAESEMVIEKVDGPPSKQSPTVVVHYLLKPELVDVPATELAESPEQRVRRLAGKLRGLLKEELAAYGGGEAFLKWIRSEGEE